MTAAFRQFAPEDPVCYDFALTRLGIRHDTDLDAFLRRCLTSGLVLDYVIAAQGASVAAPTAWMLPAPVKIISAFALLAILTATFFPRLTRQARAPLSDEMKTATISIRGMHCAHCVESVTRALEECAGVESADVNLKDGKAVVHGYDSDVGALCRAVEKLGYSADVPNEADGAEHNEG